LVLTHTECGKHSVIGFFSSTSIHNQIIADTGITLGANFTGANKVAANFSSVCLPSGIAPTGTVTVTS